MEKPNKEPRPTPTPAFTSMLDRVRVLDLTRLLPGPYASMWLGDLGADVVKIEDTGAGDLARWMPPATGDADVSAVFASVNRNKRSVCLDLKHPEGRAAFLRLAGKADLVLEGFRPGVADRLGVGYESCRAVREDVVYLSLTGYGQNGPYHRRAGHDINYLSLAGALGLGGLPGGAPSAPGIQVADVAGGALLSCFAAMSALFHRERTGCGQYIDIAMMDGVTSMMAVAFASFFSGAGVPGPGTQPLGGALACYNVYETSDGRHLAVGALEPKFWSALRDALGVGPLAGAEVDDPKIQKKAREELARVFREHTLEEWIKRLDGVDACVAPVLTVEEAAADRHARARGAFETCPRRNLEMPAFPAKFSRTPARTTRPAPALGEHTREVLVQAGYSPEEVAHLMDIGAAATPGSPAAE